MKKIAVILAMLVFSTGMARAAADDFEFEGLTFGMSPAEVTKQVGWSLDKTVESGKYAYQQDIYGQEIYHIGETNLKGVDLVQLRFHQERLYQIRISYLSLRRGIESTAFKEAIRYKYKLGGKADVSSYEGLQVDLDERRTVTGISFSLTFISGEGHGLYLKEVVETLGRPF